MGLDAGQAARFHREQIPIPPPMDRRLRDPILWVARRSREALRRRERLVARPTDRRLGLGLHQG
jgi:hypothetical protein